MPTPYIELSGPDATITSDMFPKRSPFGRFTSTLMFALLASAAVAGLRGQLAGSISSMPSVPSSLTTTDHDAVFTQFLMNLHDSSQAQTAPRTSRTHFSSSDRQSGPDAYESGDLLLIDTTITRMYAPSESQGAPDSQVNQGRAQATCGSTTVLPVDGQGLYGVIITKASLQTRTTYSFKLLDQDCTPDMYLTVQPASVQLFVNSTTVPEHTISFSDVHKEKPWIPSNLVGFDQSEISLWISVDKKNGALLFMFGYPLRRNIILSMTWSSPNPANSVFGNLRFISNDATAKEIFISKTPVVKTPPPVLMTETSLPRLSQKKGINPKELGAEGELLYNIVKDLSIKDEEAYKIDLCLKTVGCFLHEKLEEKKKEFGEVEGCMAYIRVTVGPDEGGSPGSPYVLELWPPHCRSPIHNHANAVAVIKVLFGSIQSYWFNPLAATNNPKPVPLGRARFSAGDFTYLTPRHWQTHQLENPLDVTCITMQMYQYPDEDNKHYEYFDYLDGDTNAGDVHHFRPDSDFIYNDLMDRINELSMSVDPFGKRWLSRIPFE
eukprot:gb/GEZN01005098.1/.p1 GENE.gb/GEZN01005098.1/~~gb/GEZN01005098.1/.p1  ORF type:complete len:550 (-),score=25.20 gb/GEZN01005098.1/:184-1833(-)